MRTSEELNRETDPRIVRAMGAIRRMIIALTDSAIWQITGVRMPDGSTETRRAEVFGGIGIYARPPGSAEAIVANVGDASTPVIVGIRDEATRAAVAGDVKPDETMLFNSQALLYLKDDGTIEARAPGGVAKRLATVDDLTELRTKLLSWIPVVNDGGAALKTILTTWLGVGPIFPWPVGTSKLKGE